MVIQTTNVGSGFTIYEQMVHVQIYICQTVYAYMCQHYAYIYIYLTGAERGWYRKELGVARNIHRQRVQVLTRKSRVTENSVVMLTHTGYSFKKKQSSG